MCLISGASSEAQIHFVFLSSWIPWPQIKVTKESRRFSSCESIGWFPSTVEQNMAVLQRSGWSHHHRCEMNSSFSSSADVSQADTFVRRISNCSYRTRATVGSIRSPSVCTWRSWLQQLHSSASWSSRLLRGERLTVWPCCFSLTV